MKAIIMFALILLSLASCIKERFFQGIQKDISINSEGVAIQLPAIWGESMTDGPPNYGMYAAYTYKNNPIALARRKTENPLFKTIGESYLVLKDLDTGKNIWSWNEKFPTNFFDSFLHNYFIDDNLMVIVDGSYHYCINLETGKTVWKIRQSTSYGNRAVTNLGNTYYLLGILPETQGKKGLKDGVFKGDISNGQVFHLITPKYETIVFANDNDQTLKGLVHYACPIKTNADILLAIVFSEAANKDVNANWHSYIGLYNTTQKSWLYEKIELSNPDEGGTSGGFPRFIDNDMIIGFGIPTTIGRFDVTNGQWKWRNKFLPQGTSTSDILVAANKILVNGTDGVLYCLNSNNGSREWEQKANVATSDLYYQDGVVYCIGGKNLKAIEVATGKLLWDMPSPDIRLNKITDSWFQGFVTGVPAKDGQKGKIIATTDHSIYCFEAAK
jgi:outer membrane protein assembly factor BamB